MTEQQKIKVTVSKSDEVIKEFEEGYEGSLTNLVTALKNIRMTTNDYLTELVNEEKNVYTKQKGKSKPKAPAEIPDNEESDVEIEEDFIDSQIKQELSTRHGLGSDRSGSEKRTRSESRNRKKLKNN